jgi:uncharacterized protein (DUF927 family)
VELLNEADHLPPQTDGIMRFSPSQWAILLFFAQLKWSAVVRISHVNMLIRTTLKGSPRDSNESNSYGMVINRPKHVTLREMGIVSRIGSRGDRVHGKEGTTRNDRRRFKRTGGGYIHLAPATSSQFLEDASLPLAMTDDPETMQILEALSTHQAKNGRPAFLPGHAAAPSKANTDYKFDTLNLKNRTIFLVFSNCGADRAQSKNQRDIERELRQRGARLYDLNVVALGGGETLDHSLATKGVDAALELFARAEHYHTRNVPEGYRLSSSGVYRIAQPHGALPEGEDEWICSSLLVKAHTRNHQNEEWGKLLEFPDQDATLHRSVLRMSALAGRGGECCAQLLSQGLRIAPGRKAHESLITYILGADPEERVRCTNQVGWHGDTYVLPEESIRPEGSEPVFYQTTINTRPPSAVRGRLEDWINAIGRLCPGNSRLVFAVSCAFAPPLLRLTNEPGGGFNFCGASSTGKTTALLVAASVWGGEGHVQNWRMTANSLDAVAQNHNDSLLCLDELGQADGREVGEIVYAVANGSPKQRKTRSISRGWTLLVLSSGETTLADHMHAAGRHVRPGQEVRLCDLAADAGTGLGLFQDLNGFANPSAFARHLGESTGRYFGSPIRAFLRTLVEDREKARQSVVALRGQFLERHLPTDASGELRRAASRFALIAAAGELATTAGVTGWEEGESMRAAGVCFESWLNGRGTTAAGTSDSVIQHVRRFLETQETPGIRLGTRAFSQNQPWTAASPVAGAPVGGRSASPAYRVLPQVFRRSLCAGFDPRLVLRILKTHGYLDHDHGRSDKSVRLPGIGKRRVYSIKAHILDQPLSARLRPGGNSGDSGDNGNPGSKLPQTGEPMGNGSVPTPSGASGGIPATALVIEDLASQPKGAGEPPEALSGSADPLPAGGPAHQDMNTFEA